MFFATVLVPSIVRELALEALPAKATGMKP